MHKVYHPRREREREEKHPIVLVKLKEAYRSWMELHKNFPKVERLGIGQKIEKSFLDTLELIFVASFLSPQEKMPLLGRAISRLDVLKFFIQLAWESKLFTTEQYSNFLLKLEEAGRMLGGWRKGLQNKTPASGAGERR